MALSYKRLFKLMIDRNMMKKDLCELAGISTSSVTKLSRDQNVNTEILSKICDALECNIEDIVENVRNNEHTGEPNNE